MTEALFLPSWPLPWSSAVTLALLLLLGVGGGEAAARLGLPRLVGQTLAGLLCGLAALGLSMLGLELPDRATSELALGAALAVVLFEVGRRAPWSWLGRNHALLATSLAESALSFVAVDLVLLACGMAPVAAAITAAVCMSSSPIVVLAISKEFHTQGQITERSLLLAALNSGYAVVAGSLLLGWVHVETRGAIDAWVLHPLYLVFGSLLLAWAGARLMASLVRRLHGRDASQLVVVLAVIGLVFLGASRLQLSPLLATLALGALAGRSGVPGVPAFDAAIGVALIALFSLSAVAVDFDAWAAAWQIGLLVVAVRLAAKTLAVLSFIRPSGLPVRKAGWLALGLAPMSLPTLLLVHQVAIFDRQISSTVGSVAIVAAVLMQVAGAIALAWALRRNGEMRHD
ncbi:MAG: cation:proton antiporter [Burkholderiaceae bacterium]